MEAIVSFIQSRFTTCFISDQDSKCSNGGVYQYKKCWCYKGYTGEFCEAGI